MKKVLTSVAMVLLLAGCAQKYDDTAIKTRLDAIETRLTALEGNIQALQSAIGEGVFVAKVQEYVDPDTGKTIGVTVTYTSGDKYFFEIEPRVDYEGPVLGVIMNGAGDLVWAIDGIAIKDAAGNDVTVYQTPAFTIDDEGNLWVSIDGDDPINLGPVTDGGATLEDGIFTDIKVEQDKIVLTLSDESVVNIPFAAPFKLIIENDDVVFEKKMDVIEVSYQVSGKTEGTVVGVSGYNPNDFVVEVTAEKILITPLDNDVAAVMTVYADSKVGLVSMVQLTVNHETAFVTNPTADSIFTDFLVDSEGADLEVKVLSNVEIDAVPDEEWVTVVETKALNEHSITLKIDANTSAVTRMCFLDLYKKGTTKCVGSIEIDQMGVEIGPKDLGKKATANSYIVSEAGEYKFKTVKGNTTESVGTVASAALLWETVNTTTAPDANAVIASVAYADGFITFATPETLVPGNALIAAKDAEGTILWSWHIWIPATEIASSTYEGVAATPMMDRNLGALVAAKVDEVPAGESIGFLYQWGRKDPFPGTASVSSSSPILTNGTITLASEKTNFTIVESIQNPTTYVKTGGDTNKTWMTAEEMNIDFWGVAKTVYDPCPPGYMVPTRDKTNSKLWAATAKFTVDETNKLLKVSAGDTATEVAVFPVAGYLDQGEYCKVGVRSYLWSSYASSSDKNIAYYMYINGTAVTVDQQRMSRGGHIRCVVEPAAE